MIKIITDITDIDIEIVKDFLSIDHSDDDIFISNALIPAAKSFIQTQLNRKFDDFEELPHEFTIAALNLIAYWYENRDIQPEKSGSELNYLFAGLLDSHRIFQVE